MTLERQNLNWVVAPQEFVVTEPAVKLGPDSTADKTAESPKPEYFGMEKFLSMHPNDIKEYLLKHNLKFTEEKNLVLKEELTRARKGITTQRERGLPQ